MAENFFGITHTGKIRDNNEDAFIAEKLPNGWIVACVIDGVGGYEGGEVAAGIAKETIRTTLQTLSANPVQTLKESLLSANQNIYQEKLQTKGRDQMACVLTIALVDVDNNQFYYAHVGDTRMYLLRDQTLVKVTKDHSFVGFLEDSGRLSEKEAMAHPKRNEINKALGFDPQIDLRSDYIETGASPFLPGDMLLLCSDGLSDLVDKRNMTSLLISSKILSAVGQALIDAANNAGGKDNITVVVVHNSKKPVKIKATKPVKKNDSQEDEVDEVTPAGTTVAAQPPAQQRKGNGVVWILSLVCLLLAALCFWLWQTQNIKELAAPQVQQALNLNEKKLADNLGLANDTLSLSEQDFGKSIVLSDTLFVRQDTLHINGNGLVLSADSTFLGPAIVATVNNKIFSLENVVFNGFSTAVLLQNKGLQLKNVRFLNCKVPVQHQLLLPLDSTLNGFVRDTFLVSHNTTPR